MKIQCKKSRHVLLRAALHGVAVLACAAMLAGCAAQHASSGASGSKVEAYGEIDVGYSHSRTKTTVLGK